MHVNNLPLSSAFTAELRGGYQFRGWDEGRYMTARLINMLAIFQHIFVLANSDPKKKPPMPEMYPVPDQVNVKQHQQDKPGSFAWIAKAQLAKIKKLKDLKRGGVDGWR